MPCYTIKISTTGYPQKRSSAIATFLQATGTFGLNGLGFGLGQLPIFGVEPFAVRTKKVLLEVLAKKKSEVNC